MSPIRNQRFGLLQSSGGTGQKDKQRPCLTSAHEEGWRLDLRSLNTAREVGMNVCGCTVTEAEPPGGEGGGA